MKQIAMYRKLGLQISEIKTILATGISSIASIARKQEFQSDLAMKKRILLENILEGATQEQISHKLADIEKEETIFEKLERAFPGYLGQMLFAAYRPFLDIPLKEEKRDAYDQYIAYLDQLPPFELTEQEQKYIEELSSSFDLALLEEVNDNKIQAVFNSESWLEDHGELINQYLEYKKSQTYVESPLKLIYDKFQCYLTKNHYYEVAIPLIRQFSDSYDRYYQQLMKTNTEFIEKFGLELDNP